MTQPCRPALRRSRHLVNPAAMAGSRAPVRYPDAREELSDAIQPLTSDGPRAQLAATSDFAAVRTAPFGSSVRLLPQATRPFDILPVVNEPDSNYYAT